MNPLMLMNNINRSPMKASCKNSIFRIDNTHGLVLSLETKSVIDAAGV
ncbi:MAG: hypothetical protein ACJ72V_07820 [Nitrososphaeraceae archaeon]